MMISPETFYEERLKKRTKEEVLVVIDELKTQIAKLKNDIEKSNYFEKELLTQPSEDVQIIMNREYLEHAKTAFAEAGGEYNPSIMELADQRFNANIQNITKIEFEKGYFVGPRDKKTFSVSEMADTDKEMFLDALKDLHLGEWRKNYSSDDYGVCILDGEFWDLKISFSNGQTPATFHGDNAYPYNFDRFLEVIEDNFDVLFRLS